MGTLLMSGIMMAAAQLPLLPVNQSIRVTGGSCDLTMQFKTHFKPIFAKLSMIQVVGYFKL